jgi:hypothetical protein
MSIDLAGDPLPFGPNKSHVMFMLPSIRQTGKGDSTYVCCRTDKVAVADRNDSATVVMPAPLSTTAFPSP